MGDASVPTNVTIRPYERDGLLQKPTVESRPTPPRLTLAVNLGGWAGAQRRWLTQTLFLYPSHLTNAALISENGLFCMLNVHHHRPPYQERLEDEQYPSNKCPASGNNLGEWF